MTARPLLDHVLAAAGRGWRIFPLVPGRKTPRAEAKAWERAATCDPDCITRWWANHPHDNYGIATGPSGLVVIDLDVPKPGQTPPAEWAGAAGGADVYAQLAQRHGAQLAPTFTVHTPSGGWHLYHQAPTGLELRNTDGNTDDRPWKIDTRAHGGYIVGPGSIIGRRRYLVTDDTPPVPLPGWLISHIAPRPQPATGPAPEAVRLAGRRRGYMDAALTGEVQRVLEAGPGARNAALRKAAWSLARFVATGAISRQVVEDALYEAAVAAGYAAGPRAARAVIANSINARLRGTSR